MTPQHNCPNCDSPVDGQYCSNCGQIQKDVKRFFLALVNEAFEDVFSLNSRMWKTVSNLLVRPGFLTSEYFKGRRVRYVQPVRLYFVTSILFFVMLSLVNIFSSSSLLIVNDDNIGTEIDQLETKPDVENSGEEQTEPANPQGPATGLETDFEAEFDESGVEVNLPFTSAETNQRLTAILRSQIEKTITRVKEDPSELVSVFIEFAPPIIFCLLPLFALLLKFCYLFKGVYYTEHLVFAVHNHSFIFLTLLLFSALDFLIGSVWANSDLPSILITIWIPLYLWLGLKRVYGQGKLVTTIKFVVLGLSYCMLLAFGGLIAILIGIFTL